MINEKIEEDEEDLPEGTLLPTGKHEIFEGFIRDYTVFGEKHHSLPQITGRFSVKNAYIKGDLRGPFYFMNENLPPFRNGWYVKGVALTKRMANSQKLDDKINIVYSMNISEEKDSEHICYYRPFNPVQDY